MKEELLTEDLDVRHNKFSELMQSFQAIDKALFTAKLELGKIYLMRDDLYYMFMHEPGNK